MYPESAGPRYSKSFPLVCRTHESAVHEVCIGIIMTSVSVEVAISLAHRTDSILMLKTLR